MPRWIRRYLDEAGVSRIREAVLAAEARTSGEIVPMVVRRVAPLTYVPPLIFSLFTILVLGLALSPLPHALPLSLTAFITLGLLVSWPIAGWLSHLDAVQRQFLRGDDLENLVRQRAELAFFQAGLNVTEGRTGILIFAALMEHRVIVLADKAIADKLPPETWQTVVDVVVAGIKRGDLPTGFEQGINLCGQLLSNKFPRAPDDKNELRDEIIILES